MAKSSPSGEHGRPGAHRADGWEDGRRDNDRQPKSEPRLTHQERYGVQSNVPIPGREK
jgi:hypothetical protein